MKKWLFFLFLPFCLYGETEWKANVKSPFGLTIKYHPESIVIGENLDLEAEFQYPPSYEIDSQALIDQLLWSANPLISHWMLVKSEISPFTIQEGVKGEKINLTLAPLALGQLELSFFIATFFSKEKDNSPLEIITPVFSFQVTPLIPSISLSPASLLPLEPQFPLGLTEENKRVWRDNPETLEKEKEQILHQLSTRSFLWIALTFLLGCGGLGWFLYLMREHLPKRKIKGLPPLSSKQKVDRALKELDEIVYRSDEASLYYHKLSLILHHGIEAYSAYDTQKLTTEELEKRVRQDSLIPSESIDEICSLLKEIDQVKYAAIKPSQKEVEKITERMRGVLDLFRLENA